MFRNISPAGPVDIVVLNTETGKLILVDVKATRAGYVRKCDGVLRYPAEIKLREDGVWQILYVHGETAVRLPAGLWEALGMETAE